jgi:hypothetical protein
MAMDGSRALKQAAKIVFPNMPSLLCVWHVNKRILAKCKSYFSTKEEWDTFFAAWHSLIQSPTFDMFEERWLQFRIAYDRGKTKLCIEYIKKEWIYPGQTEQLVTAWTNEYQHFDTTVTSR